MYAKLFRNYLHPFYETFLMKRMTLIYLKELEKNQWLSEGQLKEIQWNKLIKLLNHAYENVPYYRMIFNELKLHPKDIRTPSDFNKLPLLTRENIRAYREQLIAENFKNTNLISKTTSGSTGVPLEFKYDRDTYEWHMAAAARGDRWAGWDYGEKELYIWGRPPYREPVSKKIKENIHHTFLRRDIIDPFGFSTSNLLEKINQMNRFKPKVIIGYSSAIYNIARFIKQSEIKCHSPRAIITSAEKLFSFQRTFIESIFRTKVYDRYGCQEVMLIATECEKQNGLHMNIDNLYIEILKNGNLAQNGETGDIVITDLNNYSFPFIRYKNGDLGVLSDKKCGCGRGLPLLEKVEGRTIDTIFTSDGKMVSGEVFLYILDKFEWVHKFRIRQTAKNNLIVEIVKEKDITRDINKDINTIKLEMKKVFGEEVNIEFKFTDEIPLTQTGKYRFVISEVMKEHVKIIDKVQDLIRVMFVLPSLDIGGSENALIRLINGLDENKYQCSICCLEYTGSTSPLEKKIKYRDVEIFHLSKKEGLDFSLISKLSKLLTENKIMVVHARNWSSILYGGLAVALLGNKPLMIGDVRGQIHSLKHYITLKLLSPLINKFVSVTHNIALSLTKIAKIKKSKIEIIPNGIDYDKFSLEVDCAKIKEELEINSDDLVIGTVGRLAPVKDYQILVKAFSLVREKINNVKLIFVGDGPERERLGELAKELNVNKEILFLGFRNDVEKLYRIMDVFVLTSIFEGSSNSILEAMASGIPVAATNVGGNKEIIKDGRTGLLFFPKDYQNLADILNHLLSDKSFATKISKDAQKQIKEEFSLDKTVESYERVYQQVLRR